VRGTVQFAELRHVDFGLCAMDELVNQAPRSVICSGQARVPLVVRRRIGTRAAAAPHCLSNEAWFVHIPVRFVAQQHGGW